MPSKRSLENAIEKAEHALIYDVQTKHKAKIDAITAKINKEKERYTDKIEAAICRVKNVRIEGRKDLSDCMHFISHRKTKGIRHNCGYGIAFVVNTDEDARLATLIPQVDKAYDSLSHDVVAIKSRAKLLLTDLNLCDRCREGDDLHKRISLFVADAMKNKAGAA